MSEVETEVVRSEVSSKEIREARVRRLLRRLGIWVVVPTLLSIVYYGFLAAPQYDSVAVIRVQTKGGGKSKASEVDSMLVKEYVESRDMIALLTTEHSFANHYQENGDFVSRLSAGASTEDIFDHYGKMVQVKYQSKSRTLKISVRAFSVDAAHSFATAILSAVETMTNVVDGPARAARLSLAEEQVAAAGAALSVAQIALSEAGSGTEAVTPEEIARVETVRYKRDVARKLYESALEAQTKLSANLVEEELYVAVVSPPSRPSGSSHPRRLWGILTIFVLAIALMGVFSMLGAALKEHARF
jgi:capsule polysaccharide export protein KpsE/RkpR